MSTGTTPFSFGFSAPPLFFSQSSLLSESHTHYLLFSSFPLFFAAPLRKVKINSYSAHTYPLPILFTPKRHPRNPHSPRLTEICTSRAFTGVPCVIRSPAMLSHCMTGSRGARSRSLYFSSSCSSASYAASVSSASSAGLAGLRRMDSGGGGGGVVLCRRSGVLGLSEDKFAVRSSEAWGIGWMADVHVILVRDGSEARRK